MCVDLLFAEGFLHHRCCSQEFCQNLKELHFSESFINPEDVEAVPKCSLGL